MKLDLEALAVARADEQLVRLGADVIHQADADRFLRAETCPVCRERAVQGHGLAKLCPICRARGYTAKPCAAGCGGFLTRADRVSSDRCKACRAAAREERAA